MHIPLILNVPTIPRKGNSFNTLRKPSTCHLRKKITRLFTWTMIPGVDFPRLRNKERHRDRVISHKSWMTLSVCAPRLILGRNSVVTGKVVGHGKERKRRWKFSGRIVGSFPSVVVESPRLGPWATSLDRWTPSMLLFLLIRGLPCTSRGWALMNGDAWKDTREESSGN